MTVVGVDTKGMALYLEDIGNILQIVCYNSPSNATLSGTVEGSKLV
jgi:hypothetical protein